MKDFAAIDFETANKESTSVCSVGLVIVRDGRIAETFYSLIQPVPNEYDYWNKRVHGLDHKDTDTAETFPDVWKKIVPKIGSLPLVAHNKAFDERCLKAVCEKYNIHYSGYKFYCTLQASRIKLPNLEHHRLDDVARACGYNLTNHHHALADAEACAAIALKLL